MSDIQMPSPCPKCGDCTPLTADGVTICAKYGYVILVKRERPEMVACAAIQGPHGITVSGKRHHDCLAQIKALGMGGLWRCSSTQGFMTTHGRFVDRIEARKIQEAAGITSVAPGGYRGRGLFSEDLY